MSRIFTLIFLCCAFVEPACAAVAAAPAEVADRPTTSRQLSPKQEARLEALSERLYRKMAKKSACKKIAAANNIWDDSRFRIGVILILGAIGIALLGAIIGAGGFFGFLAGLAALAGVVLVIWSLVEYYG
jgi:hypothetical protein